MGRSTAYIASAILFAMTGVTHAFVPSIQSRPHQMTGMDRSSIQAGQQEPVYSHHSINTSRRAAEILDRPMSSDSRFISDFEKRMKKVMTADQSSRSIKTTESPGSLTRPTHVHEVLTLQDYKKVVADEKNRIVVVRFYASWCRACRAVAPSFYRLAHDYADQVKFVEVPVTSTSVNIHQGLGVPTIPFAHIYHPDGGLVEELRMSRKRFPHFQDVLRTYVSGSCELPDGDCSDPYAVKEELEN